MAELSNLFPAQRPFRLELLAFPPACRVLVLAPHPDDFDAIGVTLCRLQANGSPIQVAVLSSASGVDDTYGGAVRLTPAEKGAIRQGEQRRSCAFFGLPSLALHFPAFVQDSDWQPELCAENAVHLRTLLDELAPDLVFLPHGQDSNPGHQAVYTLFRKAAVSCRRPLTTFYIKDPKTIAMRIDAYVTFAAVEADWKATLLRFHDSQQQRNLRTRGHGFDTRILQVNAAIAAELGITEPYAEAFELELFGVQE